MIQPRWLRQGHAAHALTRASPTRARDLTSAQPPAFGYDAVGNRTRLTAVGRPHAHSLHRPGAGFRTVMAIGGGAALLALVLASLIPAHRRTAVPKGGAAMGPEEAAVAAGGAGV